MVVDCMNDGNGQEISGNETRENIDSTSKKPVLLTASEAAALCKISESMFRKLHKQNKTPKAVLMGNLKRWINTEIEAWILAGCPGNSTEKNVN